KIDTSKCTDSCIFFREIFLSASALYHSSYLMLRESCLEIAERKQFREQPQSWVRLFRFPSLPGLLVHFSELVWAPLTVADFVWSVLLIPA
ncbi:mCG145823, partial [Mus musculus]